MARIHPSAIVHPEARLAADVEVGPYSIIGPHVEVGEGSQIAGHVVLEGHTRIGKRNRISHFSVIGGAPQDKKYADEPTRVEIGDGNTIREYVTINRGTTQDAGATRVGNDNWIMSYVHLAHDCQVGNQTIFANLAQLAGHVVIEDWVILGGNSLVHQFVNIGAHAFVGFATGLTQDVPPYVTVSGARAEPIGINKEGLRRRGFSPEAIEGIKRAYKTLYRKGLALEEAKAALETQVAECPEVQVLLDFIKRSKRGIVR